MLSEQTDLGIGRFFYLAIALMALATGPLAGAAAGGLAIALYSIAVVHGSPGPASVLWSSANGYRFVTYVALGLLVGGIAQSNRDLVDKLRVLAECDPLTGLANSRSFGNAIGERLERGRPFALLIGDMNSLKQINDHFGHAVGDESLKQLATVLSQSLVSSDVAYRIGGDEFAVLAEQDTRRRREPARGAPRGYPRRGRTERQLRLGGHPGRRGERDLALPGRRRAHVRAEAGRPARRAGNAPHARAGLGRSARGLT